MLDGKSLSKMIRDRKKNKLRPDMDDAGQEAVDPNVAWDEKQAMEVNEAMDESPETSASPQEMGENESSQDKMQLKKSMARIMRYIDSM